MAITFEAGIQVGAGIEAGYTITEFVTEDSLNIFITETGNTFIEE